MVLDRARGAESSTWLQGLLLLTALLAMLGVGIGLWYQSPAAITTTTSTGTTMSSASTTGGGP